MSRPGRVQSGVAYALALIMAITGMAGVVGMTTSSAAAQSTPYVSVSCSEAIGGSTECVFSAPGADQLLVPAANVCASFSATSGAFDGTNFSSPVGSPSISFSFSGGVDPGAGGTHSVIVGGATVSAAGDTLICSASDQGGDGDTIALPVDDTVEPATEGPIGGDVSDDSGDVPADTNAATTPGATTPTTSTNESTAEHEASTEPETGDDVAPAAVIVDPETTPETGVPATPATVTIVVYQCDVDPGAADPVSAGCVTVEGVDVVASDSGGDLGTATTDVSGVTSFATSVGSAFIVYQSTVIDGYRPTGDGRFEVQQLGGDLTISFINVLRVELGRLQIVAGLCPTSEESRTEFTIADQNNFSTASLTECGPNPGSVFTVTSDALPGGSWVVRTEADGAWRGYVPAGTYTVTASDGTVSGAIVVIADAVSVAVAVTYVHQEQGTLELQHYFCTAGTDGEYIAINPAGAPDASCSAAEATLTLTDELAGTSTEVYIGPNGSTPVGLKPGLYRVTGPQGIASDLVTITAEQTSVARVSTVVTTGSLMIYGFGCPAGDGNAPAVPGTACVTQPGPRTVTLGDDNGSQEVALSGAGNATVNGLTPGTYKLKGVQLCIVGSSSGDALPNFQISAGQTTIVHAYFCPIDDGTGGGQGGGSVSGPGDGTGGNGGLPTGGNQGGTGGDGTNPGQYTAGVGGEGSDIDGTGGTALLGQYASNSHLLVRNLPAAGSGDSGPSNYWWPVLLLISAIGLTLLGRRQQVLARQQTARRR